MLSYRHSFHAGNHADVLKHICQMLIIESLQQKEKGFYYLDTHAGTGRYRLSSEQAEKTGEFIDGIGRLWQRDDMPATVQRYVNYIKKVNSGAKQLHYYAGSCLLAAMMLRPQDRALFTELHPSDFPLLRNQFKANPQIKVKREDGFLQLKSTLPPQERRGLVLIDPPYELKQDYELVVSALQQGYKRFATGIYAIWYPVVFRQQIKQLIKRLEHSGIRKILQIELGVKQDNAQRGMTASGMIVVNPPWQLEQQMQQILPYLSQVLSQGKGHWTLNWIVPE